MSLQRHIEAAVQDALIPNKDLSSSAIRIRMLLHRHGGMSTGEISEGLGMSHSTVLDACRELADKGWIVRTIPQDRRRRLVIPVLPNAVEESVAQMVELDRSNVARLGEWIMLCLLDYRVASVAYLDGARPDWLRNQETGRRMEFDRLYTEARVAFEFQGKQHYTTTERFPDRAQLEQQKNRDNVKAGICARNGHEYIEITTTDLSLDAIDLKIPKHMERRFTVPGSPLASKLEELGLAYRLYMARVS